MNIAEIEKLLEKYEAGETSLHEEKELRLFFANEECPARLRKYRPLFAYFAHEKSIEMEREIDMDKITGEIRGKRVSFFTGRMLRRAVAVMLIIIAGGVTLWRINLEQHKKDEILLAKEQTDEALQYVSQKLNQAMSQINRLNELKRPKKAEEESKKDNDKNQESNEK